MPIDSKLSNIIGTKLPQWAIDQFGVRADQNSKPVRDNSNILYLANKSAWVRLVSSININEEDLRYFSTRVQGVNNSEDLAKQFVLFGGTSVYNNQSSYQLRSGMSNIKPNAANNGAYGILGTQEIQNFGYRPMPGITSVNIETQGRLGSVRQAIINFKCWDKDQLDVIDALYFKFGYSMFLEWGHTYYYPSATNPNSKINQDINKLKTTEISIVDPFAPSLTKEDIFRKIAKNSRDTEGNYDAMLGIVTNFNFVYNQEGGYDCTLRIMSLGVLGDSIKINNSSILPGILKEEVIRLKNTLEIQQNINAAAEESLLAEQKAKAAEAARKTPSIFAYINTKDIKKGQLSPEYGFAKSELADTFFEPVTPGRYKEIVSRYGIANSTLEESIPEFTNGKSTPEYIQGAKEKYDFIYDDSDYTGPTLFLQKYGLRIPEENTQDYISSLTIDSGKFRNILTEGAGNVDFIVNYYFQENLKNTLINNLGTGIVESYKSPKIPYVGLNDKVYLVSFEIDLNDDILNIFESTPNVNYVIVGGNKEIQKFSLQDNLLKELLKVFIFGTNNTNNNKEFTQGNDFSFGGSFDDTYNLLIQNISKYSVNSGNNILNKNKEILDSAGAIKDINYAGNQTSGQAFELSVLGTYNYNLIVSRNEIGISNKISKEKLETFSANYKISITDTDLITSVKPTDQILLFKDALKEQSDNLLKEQDQIEQEIAAAEKLAQKELVTQITEALSYQSALEIILRTIQVRALNESFYRSGKLDVEIGRKVYKFEMWRNKYKFIDQIFSNGIYSPIINTLINDPDKIDTANYKTDDDQFAVNAKYGFASALLGSSDLQETFSALNGKEVNYKDLLNAYVVPYQIDQELIAGVKTNHPVYIPFGLLGMILNHICTLYDSTKIDDIYEDLRPSLNQKTNRNRLNADYLSASKILSNRVKPNFISDRISKQKQKPLVYIDYNPNLNFILTNPQQLSTNPWVTLIPYEGGFEDYKKLFDPEVIEDTVIKPLSGSQETTPLFNPQTSDLLSWQLPKIKDGTVYRGKLMNVLLNIDYLTGLVRDYSFKDGTNNVYLKPFLEHILSDVNKYLGNFNAIRLSYNDAANTFQFVDDQLIPSLSDEAQIEAKPPANQPIQNRTELPLVGLKSIARSLELKTEVSSKLASMLAISANSSPSNQVQSSINGDAFGFINTNYTDRYIPARTAGGDMKAAKKDGEKVASIQFNQTVSDFYSKINPSYSDVSQATNFFINKTAIQKNNDAATRSSTLIPVGINFSTDGMGGLSMGQAFTVSENLLPRNYFSPKPGNIIDGYVNQVGFALVGVSHVIEGNTWTTSFRTQMLPVKDSTVFKRAPQPLSQNNSQLGVNRTNDTATPYADKLKEDLRRLNYTVRGDELANNGDIQPELVSVANAVFKEIRNQLPNVIVEVTAGNDLFHANLVSRHRLGQALDFILLNASQEDINKTLAIIKDYSTKYQFSYIDEYDAQKQTPNATGNHFHIAVS